MADQLNLSVAFNCSANSQPIEKTEELNWLTIVRDMGNWACYSLLTKATKSI